MFVTHITARGYNPLFKMFLERKFRFLTEIEQVSAACLKTFYYRARHAVPLHHMVLILIKQSTNCRGRPLCLPGKWVLRQTGLVALEFMLIKLLSKMTPIILRGLKSPVNEKITGALAACVL